MMSPMKPPAVTAWWRGGAKVKVAFCWAESRERVALREEEPLGFSDLRREDFGAEHFCSAHPLFQFSHPS